MRESVGSPGGLITAGLLSLWLFASPVSASARKTIAESCAIVLTHSSPEFLAAASGFVKVLTQLARSHYRPFHQMGAPKRFLLELAECLPDEARDEGRRLVEAAGLMDADADNADIHHTAVSRLLSAFRGLVFAWNRVRPEASIALDGLHEFAAASAAVATMQFSQRLLDRDARPDLRAFQNRETGALQVLIRLGTVVRHPFTKNPRHLLDAIWKLLPEQTDKQLRGTARRAIAAILDSDGGNVYRQDPSVDRILTAWTAVIVAFGFEPLATEGDDAIRFLSAIDAQARIEPPIVKFVRPSGGLKYAREVVRKKMGRAPSERVTHDFLLSSAATFLSGPELAAFTRALRAMGWRLRDAQSPTRDKGEASKPSATRSNAATPRRPVAKEPATDEAAPQDLGSPSDQRLFEGLLLLATAWNRQHADQPTLLIAIDQLHSPACLFRVFSALRIEAPRVEEPAIPIALLQDPASPPPPFVEEPAPAPPPIVEEPAPTPPPIVEEPAPAPPPIVEEPAPPPPPALAEEAANVPKPGPLKERTQEERIAEFRLPYGGLAYVRGLLRQWKRSYEKPMALREFLIDRANNEVSLTFREPLVRKLMALPWQDDDAEVALRTPSLPKDTAEESRSDRAAERILSAFEMLARAWNNSHEGDAPISLSLDELSSANGMYTAFLWWNIGGLTPEALAERPGSGFVFRK